MMDGTRFGGDDFFSRRMDGSIVKCGIFTYTDYFDLFKKDVFLTFDRGKSQFCTTI